jgi:hypothetical protein
MERIIGHQGKLAKFIRVLGAALRTQVDAPIVAQFGGSALFRRSPLVLVEPVFRMRVVFRVVPEPPATLTCYIGGVGGVELS